VLDELRREVAADEAGAADEGDLHRFLPRLMIVSRSNAE
jgi:hypothetical protein